MWLKPYFSSENTQDLVASVITMAICVTWLGFVNLLVAVGLVGDKLSRKIVHIFTGPFFLLCWDLFSSLPSAQFAAALVPLLITTQFVLIGLGILKDERTVATIARRGNRTDLLYGPAMYGVMFVIYTVVFWRHNPLTVLALMSLCGGDGFAEVIGSRLGQSERMKIPFARRKSWPGSLAMLLGSFTFSFVMLAVFDRFGNFEPQPLDLINTAWCVGGLSLLATIVEAVSPEDWDNVLIPVVVTAAGYYALPYMFVS